MRANAILHISIKIFVLILALNLIVFSRQAYSDPAVFGSFTMELNGNASVTPGGNLQLTPAINSQRGSAFRMSPYPIYDSTSFSTYFQFDLNGGTGGADGFTFLLHNDPAGMDALGNGGGDLGFGGISQSLAIEFDTYYNDGTDPNSNHIGIDTNGSLDSLDTSTSVPDINSGSPLFAWIDYDGTTDLLEIYVNTTSTKPATPDLSGTVDLSSLTSGSAYVGFSAATGGLNNEHLILDWTFDITTTAIPTLSEWGMILLSLMLGGFAIWYMRKQPHSGQIT